MNEITKRKGREKRNQCPRFCHQAKQLWRGRSKACWSGPCRFHHLFSPIRHYFPDWRAVNWSAAGAAHGNCTPPRIAPSCTDVLKCIAMQKYHYRQVRSWRDSLPRLLLDERVSLGTFRFGACIDTGSSRAGGHGAFSASLSSFQEAHLLM